MSPVPPSTGGTTMTCRPSVRNASRSGSSELVEPPYPLTSRTGPGSSWATGSLPPIPPLTSTAATVSATTSAPRTSRSTNRRRVGERPSSIGSGVLADVPRDERGHRVGMGDDAPVAGVQTLHADVGARHVEALQQEVGDVAVVVGVHHQDRDVRAQTDRSAH